MTLTRESNWELKITVDDALRAQGADPEQTRQRRPLIVERTAAALTVALPLLGPIVISREFHVIAHHADRLELDGASFECGPWVATRLAAAERLVAAVCTVGEALEREVVAMFRDDPVLALAMDGVGSAAMENLAAQACRRFQARARKAGLRGVVHCWPGSSGWPTEMAQPQIFGLLDPQHDVGGAVRLLPSLVMQPLKSLTLLLGLTPTPVPFEHECEVCAVGSSCRYRQARS